jgi:hypothetical protein
MLRKIILNNTSLIQRQRKAEGGVSIVVSGMRWTSQRQASNREGATYVALTIILTEDALWPTFMLKLKPSLWGIQQMEQHHPSNLHLRVVHALDYLCHLAPGAYK